MVEAIVALSGTIFPLVELVKGVLVQFGLLEKLTEQQQALLLRVVALLLGVGAAFLTQLNALADVGAFATASPETGMLLTGIIAGFGGEAIHVIAAWLGVRSGVVARVPVKAAPAAQSNGTARRESYAGWM